MKGRVIVAFATAALGFACADGASLRQADEAEDELTIRTSQAVVTDRTRLPAPNVPLSAGDVAKFAPLPDAPAVLAFHDICPDTCPSTYRYGVARAEFERMMWMLKAAGYTSISPAQYVRYLRADWAGLPERPILITFDDSMLSAYRGADAILQATGMRATMFVVTSRPDAEPDWNMSWTEIAAAQASGHWDIQLHAHMGHSLLPVTIDGVAVNKQFYAYKKDGETFAQWKARAEGDISTGIALLRSHLPGYQPVLFACPYGDYGQQGTNDPAIAGSMSTFLNKKFGAWFGNSPVDFGVVGSTADKPRYTVFNWGTAETLFSWLRSQSLRRAKIAAP